MSEPIHIIRAKLDAANAVYKQALARAIRQGKPPQTCYGERAIALKAYRAYWNAVDAQRVGGAK